MDDQEIIQKSYAASLQQLYNTLYDAYSTTPGDAARAEAEQRFRKGIELARLVRDRARQLV